MQRREFLKHTISAAAMLGVFPATLSAVERDRTAKIERRALGKTGVKLSVLGFGGFVLNGVSPEDAAAWVRESVEAGVNYFDIAPSYGNAEERLGPALEPFRKDIFLACKTGKRNRSEASAELDRSLKAMRTDHFDLYQLHAVTSPKEVDAIFAADGAIHAFEEARKAGKIRWIGFSAHSVEAAMALMKRYDFDTILFPVNYATWNAASFGPQVLAKAQEKKMGILALKAMAKRPWPKDADRKDHPNCWYEPMVDRAEAALGLRFTLSHPVTAAVHPASRICQKLALELAAQFEPLSQQEIETMKKRAAEVTPLFHFPRDEQAALGCEEYRRLA